MSWLSLLIHLMHHGWIKVLLSWKKIITFLCKSSLCNILNRQNRVMRHRLIWMISEIRILYSNNANKYRTRQTLLFTSTAPCNRSFPNTKGVWLTSPQPADTLMRRGRQWIKKRNREIHWVGLPRKNDAADRIHEKREEVHRARAKPQAHFH